MVLPEEWNRKNDSCLLPSHCVDQIYRFHHEFQWKPVMIELIAKLNVIWKLRFYDDYYSLKYMKAMARMGIS